MRNFPVKCPPHASLLDKSLTSRWMREFYVIRIITHDCVDHELSRKVGFAQFPWVSLFSTFSELDIEFDVLHRHSIRALHVNVDAVASTESGGSRNEMVRIVHVESTHRLSEGNSEFDAELGQTEKSDVKGNGTKPTFIKKRMLHTIERCGALHTRIASSRLKKVV